MNGPTCTHARGARCPKPATHFLLADGEQHSGPFCKRHATLEAEAFNAGPEIAETFTIRKAHFDEPPAAEDFSGAPSLFPAARLLHGSEATS